MTAGCGRTQRWGGPEIDAPVDAAYQAKYHRYAKSIIDHITNPDARAATFRLVRRG